MGCGERRPEKALGMGFLIIPSCGPLKGWRDHIISHLSDPWDFLDPDEIAEISGTRHPGPDS